MKIKAIYDDAVLRRKLNAAGKQLPFAVSLALNNTARDVQAAELDSMKQVFDRPTPYILRNLRISRATKRNLVAVVGFANRLGGVDPSAYMYVHVKGGERPLKRSEQLLQRKGQMPYGTNIVPAAGARRNRYGNINGGQLQQILSALGAQGDPAQNTTPRSKKRARKRAAYFALPNGRGDLKPGVYQRTPAGNVKPVLMYTLGASSYRPILPFYRTAEQVRGRVFRGHMLRALRVALETANK